MGNRIEVAGGTHHVFARTTVGRNMFRADADREVYVERFAEEALLRRWEIHAYCLMPNHVHWLITTPEPDLGEGIGAAHWSYARYLNVVENGRDHLFGRRFGSKVVGTDVYFLGLLRYIGRQPVPSVCARPEDWVWSSHRPIAGLADVPLFLEVESTLLRIHDDVDVARDVYRGFVAQDDAAVLAALMAGRGDAWLATAVDDFRIPLHEVLAFLGCSRATAYRQLAAARETKLAAISVSP